MNIEDIEAHAASMEEQTWWSLYVAEQSLPPCPICNERLDLLLDDNGWCNLCEVEINGILG